jgi:hypothetical protein
MSNALRIACLLTGLCMLTAAVAVPAGRPFTVRDSIELAAFGTPEKPYMPIPRVVFSPDREHFLTVTIKGNVDSGKREATLWIFRSTDVRRYLGSSAIKDFSAARVLARHASASNLDPISYWSWSSDSRSVLFLGADDEGIERLFRVRVSGGSPVALSNPDQDVSRYDERNGHVVYLAHPPVRADALYQAGGSSLPDVQIGTGDNIQALMFPNWIATTFHSSEDTLWRAGEGAPAVVRNSDNHEPLQLNDSALVVSPDGSQVLVTQPVSLIPAAWERYWPQHDAPGLRIMADTPATQAKTGFYRPKQFALVNLATGATSTLLSTPIELATIVYNNALAAWSEAGDRIALLGAYPPSDIEAGFEDKAGHIFSCALGIVQVKTHELECLQKQQPVDSVRQPYATRGQMISLRWSNQDLELDAQYVTPSAPNERIMARFRHDRRGWAAVRKGLRDHDGPLVEVHEALNEPPVLVGKLESRSAERLLMDPNPQLHEIALGSVTPYHWQDARGREWSGALVQPPDAIPGHRYPLVIQTHNLQRAQFLVDGPSTTGFAARALAAREMRVLQVDEPAYDAATISESESGAAGYRAAIKQLSSDGLVDPTKVGIIAWSHMGPYVAQSLIEDAQTYKAATFAEAAFNSYVEYLVNIDYLGGGAREQMIRAQFGAKPFGAGLQSWLQRSAGFRTDRICAPSLFQFNTPTTLLYAWDTYAALRAQDKPVELLYIRNGSHTLIKPLERLSEQGINVDWYDYWLNGHKDSDPAKAAQYARWDALPRRGC